MTRADAEVLFDAMLARGFSGGLDCALYCLDGHYSIRAKKWGQGKSDRWAVSCTPMDRAEVFKDAVETGELRAHTFADGTYRITDWTPESQAAVV